MPSDLLQSLVVLIAAIGAMLLARLLARAMAGAQPVSSGVPPTVPATLAAPAAGPPLPQEVALAQSLPPMKPLAVVRERRTRRLNPADARKGIVLATILGSCSAHSSDEGHRP